MVIVPYIIKITKQLSLGKLTPPPPPLTQGEMVSMDELELGCCSFLFIIYKAFLSFLPCSVVF